MDDHRQLLRGMLETLASVPLDPTWTVAAIPSAGVILLADASDDASFPIAEGVAAQFGEIVASDHVTAADGVRSILGVLVRPEGELVAEAGRLRGAWAIATSQGSEGTEEPF